MVTRETRVFCCSKWLHWNRRVVSTTPSSPLEGCHTGGFLCPIDNKAVNATIFQFRCQHLWFYHPRAWNVDESRYISEPSASHSESAPGEINGWYGRNESMLGGVVDGQNTKRQFLRGQTIPAMLDNICYMTAIINIIAEQIYRNVFGV